MPRHIPQFSRHSMRHPRGAVAVEFAVVGALFFLVVLAMFEFGRLNVIRHTADNAAYEAARHCMVPGATAQEAEDKAVSIMNIVGARNAQVTIEPAAIQSGTNEITVTVQIPMNSNGLVTPRFSDNKLIQSSVTLRTERVARRS